MGSWFESHVPYTTARLRRAAGDAWNSRSLPGTLASLGAVFVAALIVYRFSTGAEHHGIVLNVIAAIVATAAIVGAVFFWHWLRASARIYGDQREKIDEFEAVARRHQDRRQSIMIAFEYHGSLLVLVTNRGTSLPSAWINLFVPRRDGLTAERVADPGTPPVTGDSREVGGEHWAGTDGAIRWSESPALRYPSPPDQRPTPRIGDVL